MHREGRETRWWEADEGKRHDGVTAHLSALESQQAARMSTAEHHLRLYSTREATQIFGGGGSNRARALAVVAEAKRSGRVSRKVVRNVINAYTSMMARPRQFVTFVTDGADYRSIKRARAREAYVLAVQREDEFTLLKQHLIKSAAIFGSGYVMVARDYQRKRPVLERVGPGEIIVDEREAAYGTPRSYYRVRPIDRDVLLGMLGDDADDKTKRAIDDAPSVLGVPSQVELREAWHLRSHADADDGLYCGSIVGADLWERPYNWDRPPMVKYDHEPDPCGWEGSGLAAEIGPVQLEINVVLHTLQRNHWNGANLKVFVEHGANVTPAALNNDLRMPVIKYSGTPPVFLATDIASPQLFQYLADLEASCYQVAGVSQLNAQSQTPGATMSGRARLASDRNESQRFLAHVRRLDLAIESIGQRIIEAATDIYEECGDSRLVHYDSNRAIGVGLKDVAITDGEEPSIPQVWTSSLAHRDPAAQIEFVESLVAAGFAAKEDAFRIIDVPDVRNMVNGNLSAEKAIQEALSRILDDGEWVQPIPEMDLALAARLTLQEINNQLLAFKTPSENVEMLHDFYSQIVDLQTAATQPAQEAMPAPAPMLPDAAEMPAPMPEAPPGGFN